MFMLFRIKSIVLLLLCFSVGVFSQVYSDFPHHSEPARYNPDDSVFIFNRPSFGERNTISISAKSPDGAEGWSYQWSVYNPALNNYQVLGQALSVDTITASAGYRLIAVKGALTQTFRIWVVFNDFNINITSKNSDGELPRQIPFVTCDVLQINSALDTTYKKNYYNPDDGSVVPLPFTGGVYNWAKDKTSGSVPSGRNIAYVSSPPWEDTWYTLTVKDPYGLERSDSVFYKSVHPKAEVAHEYIPLTDRNFYPEVYSFIYSWDDGRTMPAPAKFKIFNTNSENTSRYMWVFGDWSKDSTTFESNDTLIHEYLFPGKYTIKLYTWGEGPYNCKDSMILDPVELSPSFVGSPDSLVFPNVFTPNDDGFNSTFKNYEANPENYKNDIFRIYDVSIYDISIIIFNRYGKKVHEYQGNIRNWTGWDGKVLNSNRNASEGVYYYVVDMLVGFDVNDKGVPEPKKFSKKQQTGFVHLFREPRL
jgi:hypothetical protein